MQASQLLPPRDWEPGGSRTSITQEVFMTWDFVIAALIGIIDLNPLIDLGLVPLTWFLLFFK